MISDELDQVLEAVPLEVEQAFEAWWRNTESTAGVLDHDTEAEALAAFAAGWQAALASLGV